MTTSATSTTQEKPGTKLTVSQRREVAVYDRITNVGAFVDQLGQAIYRSGMFGCESPAQGNVMAMECMARRQPPLSLAERYNVIKGKLSMKADAMLAGFRALGGKTKVIKRTEDEACIELRLDGEKERFRFTWEEAQREPFIYNGKEADVLAKMEAGKTPALKPKYATPRSRMQMLWARVVSDAVRTMAPEVCAGTYTPEEQADIAGVDLADQGPADDANMETVGGPPAGVQDAGDNHHGEVIDANFEFRGDCAPANQRSKETIVVPPEGSVAEAEAAANATGKTVHLQSEADIDRMAAQKAAAAAKAAEAMPEKIQAMRTDGYVPGGNSNGQASSNGNGNGNGLATKTQIETAKTLCKELKVPSERIAGMLAKAGVAKFSELPASHADKLLALLWAEKQRRTGKN
jgi:hypothetical protein